MSFFTLNLVLKYVKSF